MSAQVLTQAIDPASDLPVYNQIADHLREAIGKGRLKEDDRLPPGGRAGYRRRPHAGRYHTTSSPVPPRKTLWEVHGGCRWPAGQIPCRHERDLEGYSQLGRVLGHLWAGIDDSAQTAIVALSVPLDQEIHPVGEVL